MSTKSMAAQDEQDEIPWILPAREEWAANAAKLADGIGKAWEAGQWRAAQSLERLLQKFFDVGIIRKH